MRIPLFQVDVFTDLPFKGNPAAVCPLSMWLDDWTMRKVAAENNLSATAFFVPAGEGYEIRWFTSSCEIELCGHATLATAFVLAEILQPGLQEMRFQTRFRGELLVRKGGNFFALALAALTPGPVVNYPPELLEALRGSRAPTEILEANSTYFAVYDEERAVRNFRPNFEHVERLHPFALSLTAPGETVDYVSRYFAPSYGVPEDSATGSAQSALAPYWSNRLSKEKLRARQISERGGDFWCEIVDQNVIVKGQAVLTMRAFLET